MASWWSTPILAGALGAALLTGVAAAPLPGPGAPGAPGTDRAGRVAAAEAGAGAIPGAGIRAGRPEVRQPVRVPPVDGEPVRPFESPEHAYGPGHRGVDLPADDGGAVVAPAAGTVTFAGPVAGRQVTVLQHADGSVSSLEPVRAVVARGSPVGAGELVGRVEAPGDAYEHCHVSCVHWGVRVDGRYLDPWEWLGRGGPVRLLPVDG